MTTNEHLELQMVDPPAASGAEKPYCYFGDKVGASSHCLPWRDQCGRCAEIEKLRGFVRKISEQDCHYGSGLETFECFREAKRLCEPCKAKQLLRSSWGDAER